MITAIAIGSQNKPVSKALFGSELHNIKKLTINPIAK
jgi:hypothetical protein